MSSGLYQDSISGSRVPQNAKPKFSSILRRLVSFEHNKKYVTTRQENNFRSPCSGMFSDKCRKITVTSNTTNSVHRRTIQFKKGYCFATSRQNLENSVNSEKHHQKSSISQRLPSDVRSYGIMHRNHSVCPVTYGAKTIKSNTLVETSFTRLGGIDSKFSSPQNTFEMVVTNSKYAKGQIPATCTNEYNHLYDASSQAWRGVLNNMYVQGKWTEQQKKWHINCLELQAVLLTLENFLPHLRNHNVLTRSDITTILQYINKQGGTRSPQLCLHSMENLDSSNKEPNILKSCSHSGQKEFIARPVEQGDYTSNRMDNERYSSTPNFHIWGKPFIYLFASFQNRKMELFCTWDPHPAALAIDALTIS